MLKRILIPVALILLSVIAIQCKHETDFSNFPVEPDLPKPTAGCNPDTAYFVNSVLPLLRTSCAMSGCHDIATAQQGVILTDYYRIKITTNVKPGNSAGSNLYKVLSASGESKMPPTSSPALSGEQKAAIARWIDQGANNNFCNSDCNPDNFTFNADIWPLININCKNCHSGSKPAGDISLEDYNAIKTAVDNGRLYGSVARLTGFQAMPKDLPKLTDCNINQIKNWIDNGALQN